MRICALVRRDTSDLSAVYVKTSFASTSINAIFAKLSAALTVPFLPDASVESGHTRRSKCSAQLKPTRATMSTAKSSAALRRSSITQKTALAQLGRRSNHVVRHESKAKEKLTLEQH